MFFRAPCYFLLFRSTHSPQLLSNNFSCYFGAILKRIFTLSFKFFTHRNHASGLLVIVQEASQFGGREKHFMVQVWVAPEENYGKKLQGSGSRFTVEEGEADTFLWRTDTHLWPLSQLVDSPKPTAHSAENSQIQKPDRTSWWCKPPGNVSRQAPLPTTPLKGMNAFTFGYFHSV